MHFSITAQYTPQALNSIMDDPKTNRYEAVKKLVEAGGGKLVSMFSTAAEGPGVLIIFDMPDPAAASAMAGVAVAGGAIHNLKLTRLMTQDEVGKVREKARELRGAYKAPGKVMHWVAAEKAVSTHWELVVSSFREGNHAVSGTSKCINGKSQHHRCRRGARSRVCQDGGAVPSGGLLG